MSVMWGWNWGKMAKESGCSGCGVWNGGLRVGSVQEL